MAKDAFDRWWEWVEKAADSPLAIPAYLHDAVMKLSPERRLNQAAVNGRYASLIPMRNDKAR
jgi:hypothetical protein